MGAIQEQVGLLLDRTFAGKSLADGDAEARLEDRGAADEPERQGDKG